MKNVLLNIIPWFKSHWHGRLFKFSVYLGLFDIYLVIFHNVTYNKFLNFIFLEALEQLITNIIHNDNLINAISIALAGLIPIVIKVITIYFKKNNDV